MFLKSSQAVNNKNTMYSDQSRQRKFENGKSHVNDFQCRFSTDLARNIISDGRMILTLLL